MGRTSTPTQRAFGGGKKRGKKIGRIQGAAAGGFSVAALSGLSLAQLKKKAEQAETARQRAAVKAAIEKAMREIAQKDKAKAEMGGTKPQPRPPQSKAKGGAVRKLKSGGTSETSGRKGSTAIRIIPNEDPPWLIEMKKEAEKLGIPLRELLTKSTKPKKKTKTKKKMTANRGGAVKRKGTK